MSHMTKTQQDLITLLSSALFGDSSGQLDEPVDYPALKEEALAQTVYTQVYPLVKDSLPEVLRGNWKNLDTRIIAGNLRADYEHAELHSIMEEIGVPYTVIKGLASAAYYPNPIRRTMGDVDFLVARGDVEKVGRELEKRGFRASTDYHPFHVAYHRNKTIWELHYRVGGIPENSCGEAIRGYLADMIETARMFRLEGMSCRIPDPFHHSVVMLLHIINHLKGTGGIGLRHLCDWAVYVNTEDIGQFKQQYEEMGLWTFACQLTAVSARHLGSRTYDWLPVIDDVFLDALMGDIVSAGNFGRKNSSRSPSYNVIRESNSISSLALLARNNYSFVHDHPILLPVGMAAYFFRFLRKRILGKRRWVSLKDIKEARTRKALYEQFHVFEQ